MTTTNDQTTKYYFYSLRIFGSNEVKYVGSTKISVLDRFKHHYKSASSPSYKAFFMDVYVQWRAAGLDNVYGQEECSGEFATFAEARQVEQNLIDKYNTRENGWNNIRAKGTAEAIQESKDKSQMREDYLELNRIRNRLIQQRKRVTMLERLLNSTTDEERLREIQGRIEQNNSKILVSVAIKNYLVAKRNTYKLRTKEAKVLDEIEEIEKFIADC